MKKLFLLPVAAMLCFGCSKETVMEAPAIASAQSASRTAYETTDVMITDMIDYSGVYSDSYIDYTDEYGERVTFAIKDIYDHYADGNYLRVRKGSSITFRIKVWLKVGSDKIYCAIRDESAGRDDLPWRNFSDYGLAAGELTISSDFHQGDDQRLPLQIGVWASNEDFSNGQLDGGPGEL